MLLLLPLLLLLACLRVSQHVSILVVAWVLPYWRLRRRVPGWNALLRPEGGGAGPSSVLFAVFVVHRYRYPGTSATSTTMCTYVRMGYQRADQLWHSGVLPSRKYVPTPGTWYVVLS